MIQSNWWRGIFSRRMLAVFLLGVSSGLPFHLTRDTLKAWLTDTQLDLTTIGFFSLVGLPYTLKFLWAPLLDRWVPPFLGHRRGWIALFQAGLAVALFCMGLADPTQSLSSIAFLAITVSFLAASQDIAIDAYRRDVLPDIELGFGSAMAVNGYRVGMLVIGGAGALALADNMPWQQVYFLMAAIVLAHLLITFFSPSPELAPPPPKSLRAAVIDPFVEFFSRRGSLWILTFILLYKIGDAMASTQFMPFYLLHGYSKTEVGAIGKIFGFWATIGGGLLGGVMILKLGYYRCLWIFGILQAVSTWGFSWLSTVSVDLRYLTAVIAFENIASGMGTAAYAGFMAKVVNRQFTATQYALLSSIMGIPLTIFGASGGYLATKMGWYGYFTFCVFLAAPGLLLIEYFRRSYPDVLKA